MTRIQKCMNPEKLCQEYEELLEAAKKVIKAFEYGCTCHSVPKSIQELNRIVKGDKDEFTR